MSDHGSRHRQYGSVRGRMERVSEDQDYQLRRERITRVLRLLENDNLIALAASKPRTEEGMIFECNFAPEIWEDPIIQRRLQQLAANDVFVDLIEHEHSVAGKTFLRTQIRVIF